MPRRLLVPIWTALLLVTILVLAAPAPAEPGPVAPEILVPGSVLAFQSYRDNNWEIYRANDDGTEQTRLTLHNAPDTYPRLNRGGTEVVFTSKRNVDNLNIWKMNADGTGLKQLTFSQADDFSPSWSPDDTRIAFVTKRDANFEIYVMNADGSAQTRLTFDTWEDMEPAFSPDGSRIAWASRRTGDWRIWLMNADGSAQTALSTRPNSRNPAWSPDGARLAFDADADGDGRKELWGIQADGSGEQLLYDPGSASEDIWARSWSPDGRYIAFTHLWGYQDPQTWTTALLQAWDTLNPGTIVTLVDSGKDWHPDWQTTDLLAPTSAMAPLLPISPATFTVSWSGYDNGPAGLRNYDIQVREDNGPWADWQLSTTTTSLPYTGVGGHTYSFRCRARDNAFNVEPYRDLADAVTTVEDWAPHTAVEELPAHYRGSQLWVSWGGTDPGGSGIAFYDVQYRDLTSGSWVNWKMGATYTGATFTGVPGHSYAFRSRGTDQAQNVEPWPDGGDTAVTLYAWAIHGIARDNRDAPLSGVTATSTPAAFETHPSDEEGTYAAYVGSIAGNYLVSWAKAGYGALPQTRFGGSQDGSLEVFLPPADNTVRNGDLESGALAPEWTAGGAVSPGVTETVRHTGSYAALLGCQSAAFVGQWNVSNMAGTSYYPQIAVDGSGVAHVLWEQSGTPAALYYTRRNTSGAWSAPYVVASLPSVQPGLQVVLGSDGVLRAVWPQEEAGGNGDIYYAQRSGGIWSAPVNISANAGDSQNPQIAVESSGIVHAVWTDTTPGSTQVYYARRDSGGTWSSPLQVSAMLTSGDPPHLAVDASGNLHVVWTDQPSDPGELDVYHSLRSSSGVWDDPKNISESAARSTSPDLAAGTGGVLHVVWAESASGQYGIAYARRDAGGTWSSPQAIGSSTAVPLAQPRAVLDGSGVLHVLWGGDDDTTAHLYYAGRAPDGIWVVAGEVFRQSGRTGFLQLKVSDDRTLHAVWSQYASGGPSSPSEVYHLRRESDGRWSNAHNVSATSGASEYPQLVLEGGQTPHLVWRDSTPGLPAIYYAQAALNPTGGDSSISQAITVPLSLDAPTLSLLYQLEGASPSSGSWLAAQVAGDVGTTTLFSTTSSARDWTHRWFDLSPWAGQTVTVILQVHQVAGRPCTWGYVDEVSLGSAYADLWVTKQGNATAVPGGSAVYTIAYGNRGAVDASGVVLTDTLPAELSFIAASVPPVSTAPLRWEIGSLPAGSGPFTIVLTTTVEVGTPWLTEIVNPATIAGTTPELEVGNNAAAARTLVTYRCYLPLVNRAWR